MADNALALAGLTPSLRPMSLEHRAVDPRKLQTLPATPAYAPLYRSPPACVGCGLFEYVQPVFGSPGLSRWTIAGRDRRVVQPTRYDFHKDGALTLVRTAEPADDDGTADKAALKK